MKIICAGAGQTGRSIVKNLVQENHQIVCIDNDSEKINYLMNNFDVACMVGNCTSKEMLIEAGAKNADMVIATTPMDEVNILCCLIARSLGVKQTIARIREPHFSKQVKMLQEMGISLAVNPDKETAEEIVKILEIPEAFEVDEFDKHINLVECLVEEDSKLINKNLIEINSEFENNCLFGAIDRNGEIIIPNGHTVIQANDIVYIIGTRNDIIDFLYTLKPVNKKIKNIMIIEGDNITDYLLEFLNKNRFKVKVFMKDKERCIKLSDKYSKVEFINEDGTHQDSLINQGIENVDSLICLGKFEEENIVSALFANSLDIKKIVMKVVHNDISQILSKTKFASVVSPKEIIANKIISYVRSLDNQEGNTIEKLYKVINGKVEAIEFIISEECELINIPLKDLKTNEETIIAAIIRDDKVIIPNGNDQIQLNDLVIVISKTSLNDINEIIK